ncbi:MAG: hypothetical protein ACRDJW_12735 [Thermomicrobiales bacterium]
MSEDILLEQEQEQLLLSLVRAVRRLPRDERRGFRAPTFAGFEWLTLYHPGLEGGSIEAFAGDLYMLADAGLLRILQSPQRTAILVDVTSQGFAYFDQFHRHTA